MSNGKTDVWVYAHWQGMERPKLIGILTENRTKGKIAYTFRYDSEWIQSEEQHLLDPDIGWYAGQQFPVNKENFGMFLDSMPDRWGKTLMKRRTNQLPKDKSEKQSPLFDIDFLLGVQDESRMGALRFKKDPGGPFLNFDPESPIPPVTSLRELQFAANQVESDTTSAEVKKWLSILLAPGSSLGGARPKANVYDPQKHLWIAKFPSKNDDIDKAAWEFLCYRLATKAGIEMAESNLMQVSGKYRTFLTKRFDRMGPQRIHFASAMTMTGNSEDTLKEHTASYLDLAEFIQYAGANPQEDLHQLWKRIVFNILVSNTDDHLRNHGFLLKPEGWILSPAYDINPSIDKHGLSLNIDMQDNSLDLDLAMQVGIFFQLNTKEMRRIIEEVSSVVASWKEIASELNISRREQEILANAFSN